TILKKSFPRTILKRPFLKSFFQFDEQVVTENNGETISSEKDSRHSNSFVPNSNDYKSLELICSCKSGKRTVSCYTHVASVIYYLACGH
ncbi:hypothetical protein BpHYR1_049991, partial [Brachionus plicatilis]